MSLPLIALLEASTSVHPRLHFIIVWPLTLEVNGFGKVQATKGLNELHVGLPISLCGDPLLAPTFPPREGAQETISVLSTEHYM